MLNVERVRADFPILSREVNGKPLVYLDNASTSQKPRAVIDALSRFDMEVRPPSREDLPIPVSEGDLRDTFDIPLIIGLSNRIYTFSTYLYVKTNPQEGLPEYGLPAAFARRGVRR